MTMDTNGNMRSAEEWNNLTSCEFNHTDFIRIIQTDAYNQALRDAAGNAEVKEVFGNPYDPHSNYYVVDEQSILKLLKK